MATHLSFREIGERLYLSPHTVKTQALSVYRKFGVSSRSEAVERAYKLACWSMNLRPTHVRNDPRDADRPGWPLTHHRRGR